MVDNIMLLECKRNLREHIKDFIELFVEYYGEEQREYIEEKFNSALIIGYASETEINNAISNSKKEESRRLYKEVVDKVSSSIDVEKVFGNDSMTFPRSQPINVYREYCKEDYGLTEKERIDKYCKSNYENLTRIIKSVPFEDFKKIIETKEVPEKYKQYEKILINYADISYDLKRYEDRKLKSVEFLNTIYPNMEITVDNLEEIVPQLTEINLILKEYEKAKEQFKQKYEKYDKIIEENEKLKDELGKKYYKLYLKEILDFVPENIKENIENFLTGEKNSLSFDLKKILGNGINGKSLFEYFSEQSKNKLENEKTSKWEKNEIKEKVIEYFKIMGMDFGNDYENYLKHIEIWPNQENINSILEIKEKYNSEFNREYYNNMYPQKENIEEMKKRGFLYIDPNEAAIMYTSGIIGKEAYIRPNITKDEQGKYHLASKVVIQFFKNNERIDHFIIHELNHIYELDLIDVKDNSFRAICGWDILEDKIDSSDANIQLDDNTKRDYELFNEIINEKIAKDISKIMVDKGLAIFGEATEDSYKNVTSYDATNYLVEEFFNTYKKEILLSRKGNNIQLIFDAVGKENFDELNGLFKIHNQNFFGFEYYGLIDDLKSGKDTDRVRLFQELKTKRDEILGKMQENYKNYLNNKEKSERPTDDDFKKEIGLERIAMGIKNVKIEDLSKENSQMQNFEQSK